MASKIVWGLDIGQGSLKAVRAQKTGNRIEVLCFDSIEYNLTSSDNETERDAAIRQALTTFLGRHDISKEDILVSAPAHSALVRFIKLPPVDKRKIKDIVRYEAHQQIPFPLEEVIWDYQAVDRGFVPGEEVEVGIFAMRKELIHRFLSNLMLVNLEASVFQVAPIALYNFIMYERPPSAGAVIVIDIGANNTDLLILSQERVWARNLPIASNDLTNAIAREFNLPYEKAETLKRKASKSKYQARIYEAMKPALKGLIDELQRSVGYYRSVNPSQRIDHILVLGSAFKLPGLGRFLLNNLQYEVRKLGPLQNYVTDNALNIDTYRENPLGFGVALGLVTQGLGLGAMDTNLMPEEILTRRILARKKPWAFVVGGVLMLMVLFKYMEAVGVESTYNSRLLEGRPEDKIRFIKEENAKYLAAKAKVERLKRKLDKFIAPGKNRSFWLDIMSAVYEPVVRLEREKAAATATGVDMSKTKIWIKSFVPNSMATKPTNMTIDLSLEIVYPDRAKTMNFFYEKVEAVYKEIPFFKVSRASLIRWPEAAFAYDVDSGYFPPWGARKAKKGEVFEGRESIEGTMAMAPRKTGEGEKINLETVWGRAISYRIQFDAKAYKQWLRDREKAKKEKAEKGGKAPGTKAPVGTLPTVAPPAGKSTTTGLGR